MHGIEAAGYMYGEEAAGWMVYNILLGTMASVCAGVVVLLIVAAT